MSVKADTLLFSLAATEATAQFTLSSRVTFPDGNPLESVETIDKCNDRTSFSKILGETIKRVNELSAQGRNASFSFDIQIQGISKSKETHSAEEAIDWLRRILSDVESQIENEPTNASFTAKR
jgi:hypothetical protein